MVGSRNLLIACVLLSSIYLTYSAVYQQVYNYRVILRTSPKKFDGHEGKLKLALITKSIRGNGTQQDFVLTPTDIKIDYNKAYNFTIASFTPFTNITEVYLRWTLKSPFNPYYKIKKPVILFRPITLEYVSYNPASRITVNQTRRYCPPGTEDVGIKHGDGATFYPC